MVTAMMTRLAALRRDSRVVGFISTSLVTVSRPWPTSGARAPVSFASGRGRSAFPLRCDSRGTLSGRPLWADLGLDEQADSGSGAAAPLPGGRETVVLTAGSCPPPP